MEREINEKTKIKYTFEDVNKHTMSVIFTFEQIEGSTPCFYDQLNRHVNPEKWKLIRREIIIEESHICNYLKF